FDLEHGQPVQQPGETRLPVDPAVEEHGAGGRPEHIGVHERGAREREREGNDADAVPEVGDVGQSPGQPWTDSFTVKVMSRVTENSVGAPESSTAPHTSTTSNRVISSIVVAARASTVR